ncbi:DUF6443 domain-containing protein, partial [Fulvivirga imtechensis]|uniref:DUF6443 domain-containing protein n=1 Tax=Fulvivirga imtechensis TaxID=881893 RepID=UPI001C887B56
MSVVCINTTVTYTYTGSSTKFSWSLSGGGTHPPTGIGVRDFVVTWTQVGNHSVTFTDLNDPNGYCNIPVTVETVGGGTATANTPTVCQGSSATITLSGYNGNVVQWQKSVNNGSWQDISNTSTSLIDNNVQYVTRYKAFVSKCGSTVTSSIATVNVEVPNGGTVSLLSGSSSFCSGESAGGTLQLNNYEGIIKRWEKRVRQSNGTWGSWTSAGSGSETLSYGVSVETAFRAITDDGVCLQVPSNNTYTITETSPAVAGTISASKTGPVCIGETFSLSITGQDGTVNWYEKEEFHDWVPLSSISNISITKYTEYKAVVTKPLCNNEKTTNIISMSIKDPPVPGFVGTSHTVCQGGSGTVSLSGHVGTIVQWQKNEYDKITSQWSGWVLAVESNSTSYSYSNLQKTTMYRAIVKNDCNETLPSASATVTVELRPSTGDLTLTSGLAVFCGGSNTVTLSVSSYSGSFERWEKREQVSGVWGQWEPANDHIMPNEQETFTVTNTTAFRVVVKGTYCGEEFGDALTITKEQASEAGYISISTGAPEVCRNEAFSLTLNDYVGNSIEWYKKSGVHDWESLSSVENISITEDALFKAVVQNASCTADETQELAVTIKPDPAVGTFSLNTQEICEGEEVTLSVVSFSGTNLKWQYSTDNGANWSTEAEGTATSIAISVYTSAMWRAQAVGVCNNTIASNTLQLTVRSLPVTPASSTRTVCPGTELELGVDNPQVQPTIYVWYNGNQELIEKTAVNKLPEGPIEANTTYYVAFEKQGCSTPLVPLQVNTFDAVDVPARPYTEAVADPIYSVSLYKNNTNDTSTSYYIQTSKEGMKEDISPSVVNDPVPGFYFVRGKSSNGCWGPASEGVEVINHHPTTYSYNTAKVNFVRTYNFLQPSTSVGYGSDLDMENDPEKLQMATQYIDGLGRPVQEVVKMGAPSGNDLVTPVEYDETGNIKRQYLPYASVTQDGTLNVNPIVDQRNYYQSTPDVASSYFPFSYTQPERSSTGRSEATFAPGADWAATAGTSQERGIQTNYFSNSTADGVYHWDVNNAGEPVVTEIYQVNSLFVTETVDEESHATREYTKRRGQTTLKRVQADESAATWADTYYIYDNYGRLRFVLPPEAVKQIGTPSAFPYTPSATLLARWAFQYKYDHRNRLIEKRVPGADWIYMVYDNRDRQVLTQDGNQREGKNEWTFTKYDHLNRPIATGIVDKGAMEVADIRTEVAGITDFYEERGTAIHGYTDQSYPTGVAANDYLTVTYYDDYTFKNLPDFGTTYNYSVPTQLGSQTTPQGTYTFPATEFDRVKGQVTGSKTKVLDNTNTWLSTVTYYDDRYRVIQTVTENYSGSIDRFSTLYNFPGWTLATYTSHQKDTDTYGIKKRYTYDHAGRLMQGYHELFKNGTGQGEVLLAENRYNELGELIEKNLHV